MSILKVWPEKNGTFENKRKLNESGKKNENVMTESDKLVWKGQYYHIVKWNLVIFSIKTVKYCCKLFGTHSTHLADCHHIMRKPSPPPNPTVTSCLNPSSFPAFYFWVYFLHFQSLYICYLFPDMTMADFPSLMLEQCYGILPSLASHI